jgi:gas vesicle protein
MAHDNNGGTVMLAFLVGAITGAAAALLLAPATGEETREYLGQKAREGRARAKDAVQQGREIYQSQREQLTGAIERGREAFQQARERGEQQA